MPVPAAFSIVGPVAAVLIIAGSTAIGLLLGKRLTRRPGAPEVSLRSLRESMRGSRAKLREQLTPWERRFFYGYALISPLLAPLAIVLLLFGPRSLHARPLSMTAANLRYHVEQADARVDGRIEVAQRLKRLDTTIGKLAREKGGVTQMHDIGVFAPSCLPSGTSTSSGAAC